VDFIFSDNPVFIITVLFLLQTLPNVAINHLLGIWFRLLLHSLGIYIYCSQLSTLLKVEVNWT